MIRIRITADQLLDLREASEAERAELRNGNHPQPEFDDHGDRIAWDRIVPVPEQFLVPALVDRV